MPRRLPRCFDLMEATDGDVHPTLRAYLRASWWWSGYEIEVCASDRQQSRTLWRHRPDLRDALAPFVLGTVCDEHRRAFRRTAERCDSVPHAPWLEAYPELAGAIEPFVVKRAGKFRQRDVAYRACLVWARHFGGGDDAWRQLANAYRWADRRGDPRACDSSVDVLCWLTYDEATRLDHFLEPLLRLRRRPFSPRSSPPRNNNHSMILQDMIWAAHEFARAHGEWMDEDEDFYARVLARQPERVRRRFGVHGCKAPLHRIHVSARALVQ